MCERYVIPEQSEAEREFRIQHPWWKFRASFNVAPRRAVPVVRAHEGETEGVMLPWGMVPEWAEGDAAKGFVVAITAEQAMQAEVTRGAWTAQRRCILPAAGFYVWQLTAMRYRQPYFVRLSNQSVFGIAALWDRTVAEDEDDVLESCAILTTSSSVLGIGTDLSVPLIVPRDEYEPWLRGSQSHASQVIRTPSRPSLIAEAISPRINALKYDDPELIQPIDHDGRRSA